MVNRALLRRIFEGDSNAVALLHQMMRKVIVCTLEKRGIETVIAHDIYSETCTILLENFYHGKLNLHSNLPAFMMQTAKNLAFVENRQLARYGYAVPEGYDEPEDDVLSALDNMILNNDILNIAAALHHFKDADRDLLILHAVDNIPLAAIARQQNEKETTVRQRFNRAFNRLKTML